MSIRQPKPKQIRLPFAVPRPNKGAEPEARVCGICRKEASKYTCPRCNLPYCSLDCFRAPEHTQCSEPFYRATVHDAIAADPAPAAERRAMLDMLKRFEEGAAEGEDALAAFTAEEEEEDDLAAALDGVDLDTIDSNALLRLLPPSHRDAFLATLSDPSSAAAKELLDAAVAGGHAAPALLPWWEADAVDEDGEAAHAPAPEDVQVDSIAVPPGVGLKSVYNIVATCVAYVHLLLSYRLPSLPADPAERAELRAELLALLPFFAPRSTIRYTSAREAWGSVWERAADDEPLPPAALQRVLATVATILHPPLTLDPPPAALVLADISRVLGGAGAKKALFYRAAMAQLSRPEWLAVEREVQAEAERVEAETRVDESEPVREALLSESKPRRVGQGASIELLD